VAVFSLFFLLFTIPLQAALFDLRSSRFVQPNPCGAQVFRAWVCLPHLLISFSGAAEPHLFINTTFCLKFLLGLHVLLKAYLVR
jgi:hypothetical protein